MDRRIKPWEVVGLLATVFVFAFIFAWALSEWEPTQAAPPPPTPAIRVQEWQTPLGLTCWAMYQGERRVNEGCR
jgi:hypothetical protein